MSRESVMGDPLKEGAWTWHQCCNYDWRQSPLICAIATTEEWRVYGYAAAHTDHHHQYNLSDGGGCRRCQQSHQSSFWWANDAWPLVWSCNLICSTETQRRKTVCGTWMAWVSWSFCFHSTDVFLGLMEASRNNLENHREFGRQNVEAMIEARSSKIIIAFFISSFSLYFKNFGIESMKQ